MSKSQGFEYSLLVKGVFGRNRTVKFKSFPIFMEYDKKEDAVVFEYGLSVLLKLGLKAGGSYAIIEQPTEFEQYPDGVTMKTVTMFSDRKILNWTLKG